MRWGGWHLFTFTFGELPPAANDPFAFRVMRGRLIDAITRQEFTPEKFRAWLEAPMPDSVSDIKTTGEPDKRPE